MKIMVRQKCVSCSRNVRTSVGFVTVSFALAVGSCGQPTQEANVETEHQSELLTLSEGADVEPVSDELLARPVSEGASPSALSISWSPSTLPEGMLTFIVRNNTASEREFAYGLESRAPNGDTVVETLDSGKGAMVRSGQELTIHLDLADLPLRITGAALQVSAWVRFETARVAASGAYDLSTAQVFSTPLAITFDTSFRTATLAEEPSRAIDGPVVVTRRPGAIVFNNSVTSDSGSAIAGSGYVLANVADNLSLPASPDEVPLEAVQP